MTRIKFGVDLLGRSLVDKTRKIAIEKGIDIQYAWVGLDDAIEIAKEMTKTNSGVVEIFSLDLLKVVGIWIKELVRPV